MTSTTIANITITVSESMTHKPDVRKVNDLKKNSLCSKISAEAQKENMQTEKKKNRRLKFVI